MTGTCPILPNLAQELRTHMSGRKVGYLFESNRHDRYSSRATLLLDEGMPLEQV